jgi:Flp pilus assembly pilin Flp
MDGNGKHDNDIRHCKNSPISGQAAVEYALIMSAMSLAGLLALKSWARALGSFLELVINARCGERGMLP